MLEWLQAGHTHNSIDHQMLSLLDAINFSSVADLLDARDAEE